MTIIFNHEIICFTNVLVKHYILEFMKTVNSTLGFDAVLYLVVDSWQNLARPSFDSSLSTRHHFNHASVVAILQNVAAEITVCHRYFTASATTYYITRIRCTSIVSTLVKNHSTYREN